MYVVVKPGHDRGLFVDEAGNVNSTFHNEEVNLGKEGALYKG